MKREGLFKDFIRLNIRFNQEHIKKIERKIAFCKIALLTNKIRGDYLEFGVFRGDSLILAYNCISSLYKGKQCRFFGFDSFEGLPDITTNSDIQEGWVKGNMNADFNKVRRRISKHITDNEFKLIKGFFEETLTESLKEKLDLKIAKIVLVDSDLYVSAKIVLDFCRTLLIPGSVIIFDDYYYNSGDPKQGGEAKAFSEFLKNSGFIAHSYCSYGFGGKVFILHEEI